MIRLTDWITEPVDSLLDVGCNVGAWLGDCLHRFPSAKLAGVEVNRVALAVAKHNFPNIEFHYAGAEKLPFSSERFDYVTCVEVLEHLPANLRPAAFQEMYRVLRPQGRLILTVPHAGWFAWLDPNNIRFRLPGLYSRLIRTGLRDSGLIDVARDVEWHHHFRVDELKLLAGDEWRTIAVCYGGLIITPLMDWLSWPFYRLGLSQHPILRMLERMSGWEQQISFSSASYRVLLALERL